MVVEEEGGVKGCAVGCEMWICVCVCSIGLSCQGMQFSFDPVESWCGTSSSIGS